MQLVSMQIVFVYGTLKRGFCRESALSAQKFLGTARTAPAYRLFDLGSYPGLVPSNDGASIDGELYEVDELCLAELDDIEGVNQGLYGRESVKLLAPWSNDSALTYIYLQSTDGYAEINSWPA